MPFQLTPKKTGKYEPYIAAKYGSETNPPSWADILGDSHGTGFSERLFSITQHENYSMGIQYTAEYKEYGDCIEDEELPGECYYRKEPVKEQISYLLYENKGNTYNQIFSSSPSSVGSISVINEASIGGFVVDQNKNVVAEIIAPNETISLRKFNQKGKLLWINDQLPDIDGIIYDLISDTSGNIYALYTSNVTSPHSRFGGTYEDLSLTKLNGKNGNIIWTTSAFKDHHYEKTDLSSYVHGYEESDLKSSANSLLLVDEGSLLLWGTSYFPDYFSGTRVFQVGLDSGDITDSSDIDAASGYDNSELFTDGETAYLRTPLGAYALGELGFSESQTKADVAIASDGNTKTINISAPNKFKIKAIDKITNFNPSTDTLEIDKDSFGIGSSTTFAAGENKKAVKKQLAKQDFDFLYDEKKGGLYFNENGADKGYGDGGIIALLKGAPDLTSDNLEFI